MNSTARGGGVAEMLRSLLAYTRGAGVDTRWLVLNGTPEFFALTKRLHNRLHGAAGRRRPLGAAERARLRGGAAPAARELCASWSAPGDVVLLHDPQTAGHGGRAARAPASRSSGACTSASTLPDDRVREAWDFLRPYIAARRRVRLLARALRLGGLDHAVT